MAARHRNWQTDKTREKIKTTQLVNRLQKHVLCETVDGKPEDKMTTSQIKAAEILLNRTLPTLSMSDITQHTDEASLDDMITSLRTALGPQADLVLRHLGVTDEKLDS